MTVNEMLVRCLQDEDDDVEVQSLPTSIVKATKSKRGGTQITFITPNLTVEELVANRGRIGVICWITRDMWRKHAAQKDTGATS